MVFNSFDFLVFFVVITVAYYLLPHKLRWLALLLASCYFYMAFIPVYISILLLTIVIDYLAGLLIEPAEGSRRKTFLAISIIANLGILAFFKYFNFFSENINSLFHLNGSANSIPLLHFILPIGLSFHTFQAMSYTIEVYRGNQKAERHLGIYALYVMFYPQLVAGPIERPQNVLYQFREKHELDYNNIVTGLRMMLWGLFKKAVIADRLALFVDPVYTHPSEYSSTVIVIATIFFTFQMYCDFSGYSDIALGSARIMGFKLMTNFNKPYHAKNILEFWQRWHISLSTWLRDYLYIPLGGNKVNKALRLRNILIVFTASGIWHGASWNFVLWGALNGLFVVYSVLTYKLRHKVARAIGLLKLPKLNQLLSILGTLTFIIFVRIFFRAKTLGEAKYIIDRTIGFFPELLNAVTHPARMFRIMFYKGDLYTILLGFGLIGLLACIEITSKNRSIDHYLGSFPRFWRWSFYVVGFLSLYIFGVFDNRNFIYFQF